MHQNRLFLLLLTILLGASIQGAAQQLLFSVVTDDESNSTLGGQFKGEIQDFFKNDLLLQQKHLRNYEVCEDDKSDDFVHYTVRKKPEELRKEFQSRYVFLFSIKKEKISGNTAMRKIVVSMVNFEHILSPIEIYDFVVIKNDISTQLKLLTTNVIEKIFSTDIKPETNAVLSLVVNAKLFDTSNNYRNICFQLLKDADMLGPFFLVMKERTGDFDLVPDAKGSCLCLNFEMHGEWFAGGVFTGVLAATDIERDKIHCFCKTLIQTHNDQKKRIFNYSSCEPRLVTGPASNTCHCR